MNMLALVAVLVPGPTADLVREVVDGHRDTLARIRTVQGRYTFETPQSPGTDILADYYRGGDRIRIREGREGDVVNDFLFIDGQFRQLTRQWLNRPGQPQRVKTAANIWHGDADGVNGLNPARGLLLSFCSDGNVYPELGTIAADPARRFTARRDRLDATDLIRTEYRYAVPNGATIRAVRWHDPAKSYLVVRREIHPTMPSGPVEPGLVVVTDFTTTPDGVYFPTRVKGGKVAAPDQPTWTEALSDVRLNRDLPPGILTLPLPPGIKVSDEVRNTEYVGDPNWRPAGPESRLQRYVIARPAADVLGGSDGLPTQSEPRSPAGRLLLVSLALLGVVGVVVVAVRVRAARQRA